MERWTDGEGIFFGESVHESIFSRGQFSFYLLMSRRRKRVRRFLNGRIGLFRMGLHRTELHLMGLFRAIPFITFGISVRGGTAEQRIRGRFRERLTLVPNREGRYFFRRGFICPVPFISRVMSISIWDRARFYLGVRIRRIIIRSISVRRTGRPYWNMLPERIFFFALSRRT